MSSELEIDEQPEFIVAAPIALAFGPCHTHARKNPRA